MCRWHTGVKANSGRLPLLKFAGFLLDVDFFNVLTVNQDFFLHHLHDRQLHRAL